ncbi:hypothetical protein ACIRBY_28600 [Streptomyces sp. NPDC096136]|uniref:hypothetical protein n=1 Tax=Streptomyces sp. NPDC096136 TaxID=3366076 RepID=UPI0037F4075C
MSEHRKVSVRQRGWAAAGALAAWGAVASLIVHEAQPDRLFAVFAVTAIATTLPMLLQDGPRTFARACLVIGLGLLTFGLAAAALGMFLFVPAALLLLVAAFANPGNRPGPWFSVIAPFTAVVAAALLTPQPHRPNSENEPPPSLHAALDSTDRFHDRELGRRKERLRDFGALGAEMVETEPGRLVLVVKMPEHFTAGQSQEALREQVRRLPGVVDVRLCTFHTC